MALSSVGQALTYHHISPPQARIVSAVAVHLKGLPLVVVSDEVIDLRDELLDRDEEALNLVQPGAAGLVSHLPLPATPYARCGGGTGKVSVIRIGAALHASRVARSAVEQLTCHRRFA